MLSKTEKLKLLGEIQRALNIEEKDLDKLPQIVQSLVQQLVVNPVLVAFAFDPLTGQLKQVALSSVPKAPEVYHAIAQVTTNVAQQFSNIAMEVAKDVGQQGGVDSGVSKPKKDE